MHVLSDVHLEVTFLRRFVMARLPEIVPVTDLRQDSASVLKRVRDSNQPIVITQRGRAAAVLLSVDTYERRERERELLRMLAQGEKEIREGQVVDLDEVFAEVDAILAEHNL